MMWTSSLDALYKNKRRKLSEACECSSQCENGLYYGIYAAITVQKEVGENMQVYFSFAVGWKLHVTTVFVNWGFLRLQNTFLKNDKVLLSLMFVWWYSMVSKALSWSQGLLLTVLRGSGRNKRSVRPIALLYGPASSSMLPQVSPLSPSILLSMSMRILFLGFTVQPGGQKN